MNLKELRKHKARLLKARKCAIVVGEGLIERLKKIDVIYVTDTSVKKNLIRFGNSLSKREKDIYFKLLGY